MAWWRFFVTSLWRPRGCGTTGRETQQSGWGTGCWSMSPFWDVHNNTVNKPYLTVHTYLDMYYVCLWVEKINKFTVITMINNCYRYVLQVCSQEAVPYVPKMDNPLGTGHIMVADHLAFSLIPKSASTTMLRFFCLYLGPRCTYGLDKPPHVHVLP